MGILKAHWIGDSDLGVKREDKDSHDQYAVSIFRNDNIVGNISKCISKLFFKFLVISNCSMSFQIDHIYDIIICVGYRLASQKERRLWTLASSIFG